MIIKVEDNGHGIASTEKDKVFEPFFSKKKAGRSGSGLGLSIVKNIVEDHQGVLSLESSPAGTSFKIELRTCSSQDILSSQQLCIDDLKGTGCILIVDSNETQRELSTKMMEYLGYNVSSVANGKEAVAWCRKSTPDLLILDFYLEPDLNGLEAYGQILRLIPDQKAILTTTLSERKIIDKAGQFGVRSVVKKPFNIEEIGQAVKNAL